MPIEDFFNFSDPGGLTEFFGSDPGGLTGLSPQTNFFSDFGGLGEFGLGEFAGQPDFLVFDNQTGQTIPFSQAMQLSPADARELIRSSGLSLGVGSIGGAPLDMGGPISSVATSPSPGLSGWWNSLSTAQKAGLGIGAATAGVGLIGVIQKAVQGDPVARQEVTRALGAASPEEQAAINSALSQFQTLNEFAMGSPAGLMQQLGKRAPFEEAAFQSGLGGLAGQAQLSNQVLSQLLPSLLGTVAGQPIAQQALGGPAAGGSNASGFPPAGQRGTGPPDAFDFPDRGLPSKGQASTGQAQDPNAPATEATITQLYRTFLGRDPEPGIVDQWIASGLTPSQMVPTFTSSDEFIKSGRTPFSQGGVPSGPQQGLLGGQVPATAGGQGLTGGLSSILGGQDQILNLLTQATTGNLPPELLKLVEQAFQPQLGNIATQAIEAARQRGFAGGAELLNQAPAGALAGPALSDLQGQMAKAKLGLPAMLGQAAGAFSTPAALRFAGLSNLMGMQSGLNQGLIGVGNQGIQNRLGFMGAATGQLGAQGTLGSVGKLGGGTTTSTTTEPSSLLDAFAPLAGLLGGVGGLLGGLGKLNNLSGTPS